MCITDILFIQYSGGRSEQDFIEFMNGKCGTFRTAGGGLNEYVCGIMHLIEAIKPNNYLSLINAINN